jgi:phage/plasmid-like protein (TIGR03299 family)
MSANVETMGWASNFVKFDSSAPWHGSGVPITDENDLFDIDAFGKKADILWECGKIPLMTVDKAQYLINKAYEHKDNEDCPVVEPNVDHYAIKRKTDGRILGVVGSRYQILQNRTALEWFKPWLETKTIALNTMGSLEGGKKIWVLGQIVDDSIIDVTKNDSIAKFVMLSNSHDGTNSVRVGLTPIRIVCSNTLAISHRHSESKLIRLRHSSKVEDNLNNVREIIDLVHKDFAATVEQYRLLATKDINQADLRKYVRILVQGEKDSEKKWDDIPTRTQNIIKEIEGKMDSPINPGRSTFWKAMNCYTEYLNYSYGRNVSSRLNSLWFGTSANDNRKALELALQLAA